MLKGGGLGGGRLLQLLCKCVIVYLRLLRTYVGYEKKH